MGVLDGGSSDVDDEVDCAEDVVMVEEMEDGEEVGSAEEAEVLEVVVVELLVACLFKRSYLATAMTCLAKAGSSLVRALTAA